VDRAALYGTTPALNSVHHEPHKRSSALKDNKQQSCWAPGAVRGESPDASRPARKVRLQLPKSICKTRINARSGQPDPQGVSCLRGSAGNLVWGLGPADLSGAAKVL
jgi:hypothetical protein